MIETVFDKAGFSSIVREWRRRYDAMTFDEHQQIYSRLWATNLPPQRHCAPDVFLDWLDLEDAVVAEVGGWDGWLAEEALADKPIATWVNWEVCREAAAEGAARMGDWRYGIETSSWIWEADLSMFDVLVASHSLEHMSKAHRALLFEAAREIPQIYVQLPENMHERSAAATHVGGDTVGDVLREITQAGWETVNLRRLDKETIFLGKRK